MGTLFDSDVIIWILRGKFKIFDFNNDYNVLFPCCSVVSVTEVLSGTKSREKKDTQLLFESVQVLNVNFEIASIAGNYRQRFLKRGKSIGTIDAIIAATCKFYDLRLVTLNRKHYPMRDIKVIIRKNYL